MTGTEYIFRAKTEEGHRIKALAEVLSNILIDVCFTFDKNGITLTTVNNQNPPNLLVNLALKSIQFNEYYCPKTLTPAITLQHFYERLKNIKKKDSLILYIDKNDVNTLRIEKESYDTKQKLKCAVKIQKLPQIEVDVPTDYGHPIHINTNGFQKGMKDLQSAANKVRIHSKGSYINFSGNVEGLYSVDIPFGEFIENGDEEDEYEDVFVTKTFSQLTKVSGLKDKMQIYVPKNDSLMVVPLKIDIPVGDLGNLEIYIKSIKQISKQKQNAELFNP